MGALLERLGVEVPVVQAGMGGGIARHELAVAVSAAGGLGTIGILSPVGLRREIDAAREQLDGQPLAVNLLLPFARRAHFDVASEADVVVTFWGAPERRTAMTWLHQCGSVDEARAARDAGADGVIAQGVEAGGHVRGREPAAALLEQIRSALGDDYPVLSAGGIADAADVKARLEAGAEAVVCGTRFVLSDESAAHPQYKARLLEAHDTVLTELFGFGWPAPHRVVRNRATARWLGNGDSGPAPPAARGPAWLRLINQIGAVPFKHVPASLQFTLADRMATLQRSALPVFGPGAAVEGGPDSLIEAGALYAGESVARISEIRPAGELVRALAGQS